MKDWGQSFYCIFENKMLVYYKLPNMLQSMKVTLIPRPVDLIIGVIIYLDLTKISKKKRKSGKWKN